MSTSTYNSSDTGRAVPFRPWRSIIPNKRITTFVYTGLQLLSCQRWNGPTANRGFVANEWMTSTCQTYNGWTEILSTYRPEWCFDQLRFTASRSVTTGSFTVDCFGRLCKTFRHIFITLVPVSGLLHHNTYVCTYIWINILHGIGWTVGAYL